MYVPFSWEWRKNYIYFFIHIQNINKILAGNLHKNTVPFSPLPMSSHTPRMLYSSLGNKNRSCIENQFSEQFIKSTEERLLLIYSPQMLCWLHIYKLLSFTDLVPRDCMTELKVVTHYSFKYIKWDGFRRDYKCHFCYWISFTQSTVYCTHSYNIPLWLHNH